MVSKASDKIQSYNCEIQVDCKLIVTAIFEFTINTVNSHYKNIGITKE